MTTTWHTGLSQVYYRLSYAPQDGDNVHMFDSCFAWNGTDNLVVEICFNNNSYLSSGNASHYYTTTPFTSVLYRRADATGVCASTATSGTSSNRPNMELGYSTPYAVDAALSNMSSPVPACSFTSSETITVDIYNNGASTITSLPLAYTINGGTAVTETFTGSIPPCSSTTFSFSTAANLASGTSFDIEVFVNTTNDSCNLNDTLSKTVGAQMSGTYTIGGTSPDYSTIADAVDDLENIGVCGATTFLLRDASTFSETLDIGVVPGASSSNTVTFKSDPSNSSLATIQGSSYAVYLNGVAHLIIDSLNLQSSGSYAVYFAGDADTIAIKNSNIASSSNYYGIYEGGGTIHGLVLENNAIASYGYSIYLYGSSAAHHQNLTMVNNELTNFQYRGVYVYYFDSILIEGNVLNSGAYTSTQYGIYFGQGQYAQILSNDITLNTTNYAYGIYSLQGGTSSAHSVCANNMVKCTNVSTYSRGIYLGSYAYWDVYFNSIYTKSTTTSTSYASFYSTSATTTIYNNAVYNSGTGYAMYISTSATHDYNVTKSENTTATYSLNATANTNESLTNPGFNSTSDLHISVFSDTYNGGTPITGFSTDIDGDTRTSTPDIGADEYDLPENDAGVVALDAPTSPVSTGTQNVQVSFQNFGIVAIDTVYLDWEFNSTAQSAVTWTGSLAAGNTQSNVSLGSVNVPNGFSTITAWTYDPNNVTDEDMSNDTMEFTICTALSGTYTVGSGSGFDFNSIGDAIDALMTCGISGPVTIDIDAASGPYEEQLHITGPIGGASATNTITFAGGGSQVEWDAQSTNPSIFTLEGVNHVTIDSLNIESTNANYGWGVRFANGADSNTVKNCSIMVPIVTSTYSMPVVFTASQTSYTSSFSGGNGNYNTIDNNYLEGGYAGVMLYASSGTNSNSMNTISNNVIDAFYTRGVYIRYGYGSKINGNDISRINSSLITTFYGIYLYYGSSGCEIKNNRVHDAFAIGSSTGYAIYLYNTDGISTDINVVENNAIYNMQGSTSTFYGIYSYSNNYTEIRHNTIDMDDPSGTSGTTYGVYISSTHTSSSFQNNMVQLIKGGTSSKYNIYFATTQSSFSCDYNVLWNDTNSTSSYIAYYSGVHAELSNWQAAASGAYGQNSVQDNPVFASAASGNLTPLSNGVDNVGTPLGVLTDIEGNSRSTTTPDAGAYEFVGVPGDVQLVEANIVRFNSCYNSNDTVWVNIKNVVGSTINLSTDSIVANWSISGPVSSSGQVVFNSGSLNTGATTWAFDNSADLSIPGVYTLQVYLDTNAVNASTANDTLSSAHEETVDTILTTNPVTSYITSPYDSVTLVASSPLFPGGAVKFSEITQFQTTTGQPTGGWVSYSWAADDDGLELIGAPNTNLEGYTVEVWYSSSTSMSHSFTFQSGAEINTAGVAYLGWGGTAGDVNTTYNYYRAGYCANCLSSGSSVGYILKDANDNIVDVVVNATSFTWSTQSGVTASEWSGNMSSSSGSTSGIRRIAATDNNSGTDWVVSSGTYPQDPGTYNSTVNTITAPSLSALTWSLNATVVDSVPTIIVGPWTADDTLYYVATLDSTCGIFSDTSMIIIDLTKAEITASANVGCNGESTGWATVTASGGDAPYTYAWNNGSATDSATNLAAGMYYVTVTDNNGWAAVDSVEITEPDPLVASISSTTDALCDGDANGTASATVTGGTTAYSYAWSNGSTSNTASGLDSGMVYITVTDAEGCTSEDSALISDPDPLVISIDSVTDVQCFGFETGEMFTSTVGGTSAYTYLWSDGSTDMNLDSAGAGSYSVTVTDANGCEATASDTIGELDPLVTSTSGTDPLCNGDTNGMVAVSTSGGLSPYDFAWSNGSTDSINNNIGAGLYEVTVTDVNGCTRLDSILISEPDSLLTSTSGEMPLCNGDTNGWVSVNAMGGTLPYSFTWNSGGTDTLEANIGAGTYIATVTDDNGCTAIDSFNLQEPDVLQAVIDTLISANCENSNDGEIMLSTLGGTSPYQYWWADSVSTEDRMMLSYGVYHLTITDTNGCMSVDSFNVGFNNPTPVVSITGDDSLCFGDVGVLTADSGFATYFWSVGETTQSITIDSAGTYAVSIIDNAGCTNSATFDVWMNAELSLLLSIEAVTCFGGSDGSVEAGATGGSGITNYAWSNGSTTDTIAGLTTGVYTVTVTDSVGCTIADSATVHYLHELPVVDLGDDTTVCYIPEFNSFNSIDLFAGSGFSVYAWNTGDSTDSITANAPGIYAVMVTDSFGCMNSDSMTVDSMVCLGVEEMASTLDMSVYPNPTFDRAMVDIHTTKNGDYQMVLMDLKGQIVALREFSISNQHSLQVIEKGSLSAGVYIIRLTDGERVKNLKLIFE